MPSSSGHHVKYADGPTVEVRTVIDADLDTVWALVSDIDLPARFSSEFLGGSWLDTPPGPGARFVGRNRHPALGEWETVSYVSRYDPPRAFAWDVTDAEYPSASWWYELEAELDEELDGEPARVRLRYGARIGPAPSGLTRAITAMPDKEERIIARRLQEFERNMTATVEGIKTLAEEQT